MFEMYPTIITPFLSDGTIDYQSLERLIKLFADCGCDGVFAVCQSSEMFFLTDDEKLLLAKESIRLCRKYKMKCVVSGHTQDALSDQIAYLKKLEELKPDAIITVSNRFAAQNEDDGKAVETLDKILAALKPDTRLGVYECPYPYKRPLTEKLLNRMIADGRFLFVKDTCCRIDEIRSRLSILNGSGIGLYNANSATLTESVEAGCAGFSGVMLNILPEFFELLKNAYKNNDMQRIALIGSFLSCASTIECQNYPANAKYLLMKKGIIKTALTRNGKPPLTESQIKELDAYEKTARQIYYSFIPHAPVTLIAEYNTFFPECHASTVLPLENGRVLVAYFAGTKEKDPDVGIWLSIKQDGVWLKPRRVAKVRNDAHWNPVLFKTSEGVRLVFKVGKTIDVWESWTMLSRDGGESWTEPAPVNGDNHAGGPVRSKPLTLLDGRVLAPNSDESENGWYPRIDEAVNNGAGFKRLAPIPINRDDAENPNYMQGKGAIQPTLWQSPDGSVHAFLRTTAGRIFRSDSFDGGRSWCEAYPTDLPSNNSGIDVARLGGSLYLALNPVGANWGGRTPLVIMRSDDEGDSFKTVYTLAEELTDDIHARGAQFAYPAIVAKNDKLYISFTWQRKTIGYCEIKPYKP